MLPLLIHNGNSCQETIPNVIFKNIYFDVFFFVLATNLNPQIYLKWFKYECMCDRT